MLNMTSTLCDHPDFSRNFLLALSATAPRTYFYLNPAFHYAFGEAVKTQNIAAKSFPFSGTFPELTTSVEQGLLQGQLKEYIGLGRYVLADSPQYAFMKLEEENVSQEYLLFAGALWGTLLRQEGRRYCSKWPRE